MNRVKDKVAIATGGVLGIGRSACILLACEGAHVAVTDVLVEPGLALAREIGAAGGSACFWHLDVSSESAVAEVFRAVHERFGGIDVLVNNAGIAGVHNSIHKITEEEWDHLMALNVKGVFSCTKHAIPYMQTRGGGSIINLASIYGIVGAAGLPPYHASKDAVRLMRKNDALLYAPDRIRVNSIHPGFIWTPPLETFAREQGDVTDIRKQLDARHPIGHVGEPDDIGWGVVYLASDEARFVTGSELAIDGGYTAR